MSIPFVSHTLLIRLSGLLAFVTSERNDFNTLRAGQIDRIIWALLAVPGPTVDLLPNGYVFAIDIDGNMMHA